MKKLLLPLTIIVLIVIIIAVFVFNGSNHSEETNVEEINAAELPQNGEDVFANCKKITPEKYLELIKACRVADETEMSLPLNLRFGMSKQEYIDSISSVVKQSGLSGIEVPSNENNLGFDFKFPKLTMHVNPIFSAKDILYQLEMTLTPADLNDNKENLVRQMMDFYLGNRTNYNSFEKYTIDNSLYYFIKGNQLVAPDMGKGLLLFFNVPQMPESLYKEAIGE